MLIVSPVFSLIFQAFYIHPEECAARKEQRQRPEQLVEFFQGHRRRSGGFLERRHAVVDMIRTEVLLKDVRARTR